MTPIKLFERYAERIGRFDPELNAYVDLRLEEAAAEAAFSAARHRKEETLSSMNGLCVAVKSNIAVHGLPCHAGIEAYRNEIANGDAEVVRGLKALGSIILGTVNMHEGALGATTDNPSFGRTENPWRSGVTPGGSSGGSAAAVAAGLCDLALGSDTMGSVRIPSAYCGVQGFKPTAGKLSLQGVLALSPTLDHLGLHSRSVKTIADVWTALTGEEMTRPSSPQAMGVWKGDGQVDLSNAVGRGFTRVTSKLKSLGCDLASAAPPSYEYGRSRRAGLLVSEREAAAVHSDMLERDPKGFSPSFRRMLEWGRIQTDDAARAAYDHLETIRETAPEAFENVPIIIAPAAPQDAFPFGSEVPANQADFTAWANFAGLPAAAIFSGLSEEGLPQSIQIIGNPGRDTEVLSAAGWLEEVLGTPPWPPGFEMP